MEPPLPDGMILTYPVYILDQQKQRDQRNLFHFAIRLRPEFETLRGNILHRSPLPNITDAICEFMAEETRLRLLRPAAIHNFDYSTCRLKSITQSFCTQ